MHWLSEAKNEPWLLALDNADNLEMFFGPYEALSTEGLDPLPLVDFLPRNPNGSITITTSIQTERVHFAFGCILLSPTAKEAENRRLPISERTPM